MRGEKMDLKERIVKHLNKNGVLPWALGCDPEKLSEGAKRAWDTLTVSERAIISKHNPFLADRNAKIRILADKGVAHKIISELTGLSTTRIDGIAAEQKKNE